MSKFDDFTNGVLKGAGTLAEQTVQSWLGQAKSDASDFLQSTKTDLETWTNQLATGGLKQSEFEDLVKGDADLAELAALTQAGIAAADLQRFRDGLVNLVVDTAVKVFL